MNTPAMPSVRQRVSAMPCLSLAVIAICILAMLVGQISSAQTVTVIRSFGTNGSIAYPQGPPTQGKDGKLYAETVFATPTVFKEQTSGDASVLLNFFSFGLLATPSYPVLLGQDGNWYGTTMGPGQFSEGGLLYRITPQGVFTILHSFSTTTYGVAPVGSVIEISGKLYGTTVGGNQPPSVYTYDLSTGTFATLYAFNSSQLQYLASAVLYATDGNLYGLGNNSGSYGYSRWTVRQRLGF